ncbi:DUF1648 domain-containing protein [Gordonibacter sp. 28C]|uniref:DUF1648 domain-containing protein n=1 Tax=Gordonibacter sp. 28C TaxID=2078569 RepID=UPI001F54703E|nr:DUF1648 domain-containing protein [Gordonibacter sp. 28C]
MNRRMIPVLVILCVLPLAATAAAVLLFLPDTVPTHAGFSGVDRWGTKYESFITGGIVTATCVLFSLMYAKAETLQRLGMIHGTGVRGARITLVGCMALVDVILLAYLIWAAVTGFNAFSG